MILLWTWCAVPGVQSEPLAPYTVLSDDLCHSLLRGLERSVKTFFPLVPLLEPTLTTGSSTRHWLAYPREEIKRGMLTQKGCRAGLAPLEKWQTLELCQRGFVLRESSQCLKQDPWSNRICSLPDSSSCAQVEQILVWVPTNGISICWRYEAAGRQARFHKFSGLVLHEHTWLWGMSQLPCWKVNKGEVAAFKTLDLLLDCLGQGCWFSWARPKCMSLLRTLDTAHGERELCSSLACVSSTDWGMKPSCRGICRALLFQMVLFLAPVQVQWRPCFAQVYAGSSRTTSVLNS